MAYDYTVASDGAARRSSRDTAQETGQPRLAIVQEDETREHRTSELVHVATRGVGVALDAVAIGVAALVASLDLSQAAVLAVPGSLLLATQGLHRGRLTLRISDDVPGILGRLGVTMIGAAALMKGQPGFSVLTAFVWAAVFVVLGRGAVFSAVIHARRRGWLRQSAVIVGAGPVGVMIASTLSTRPEYGLQPIGFVDRIDDTPPLPLLGAAEMLPEIIARTGVQHVILAFGQAREAEMVSLVRRCAELRVQLYTLPRFFELGHAADSRATDDLWGFPIVRLRGSGRSVRRTKRAFDLAIAALLSVPAVPILAICAIAVKMSSPGPVLFRQQRVGENGRVFELLKFRSMTVNSDSDTTWTVEGDQRVTAVGRILRPTHLDELPQLWNVFKGEMSIVGPRPERPVFVEQFDQEIPHYTARHRLPVGLTGWSQVNGLWGDTSIPDRARLDNSYIESWSLWKDVVILCRTVPTLLGRRDG